MLLTIDHEASATVLAEGVNGRDCFWCIVYLIIDCFLLKIVVHLLIRAIYPCSTWDTAAIVKDDGHDSCSAGPCVRTPCNFFKCCPKRRARFEKCAKRRAQRRKQSSRCSSSSEGCCIERSLRAVVAKILLPPPLPARSTSICPSSRRSQESGPEPSDNVQGDESGTISDDAAGLKLPQDDATPETDAPQRVVVPATRRLETHLIDMVRMQQWEYVLNQPKLKRREAKYRDSEGTYLL